MHKNRLWRGDEKLKLLQMCFRWLCLDKTLEMFLMEDTERTQQAEKSCEAHRIPVRQLPVTPSTGRKQWAGSLARLFAQGFFGQLGPASLPFSAHASLDFPKTLF